jgi:hypothetical protein
VEELIARERRESHAYGGRSVLGWEPAEAAGASQGLMRPEAGTAESAHGQPPPRQGQLTIS